MKPVSRARPGLTVRALLAERLTEIERTEADLAQAAEVPARYLAELLSGRRRAPSPGRTDVYDRMTRFLRLGRTDLALCATTERSAATRKGKGFDDEVRDQVLSMCEPGTARKLRRRARNAHTEMTDLLVRVLDVAQGHAMRVLSQQIPLRVVAARLGLDYTEVRMQVLDFLDASPESLTLEHVADYIRPHIDYWDVDLETGVLRVVMRSAESTERHQRRPMSRGAFRVAV